MATHERLKHRYFWQDCRACRLNPKVEQRRAKCGWVPRRLWGTPIPGILYVPGVSLTDERGRITEPQACPGYLAQLPAVHEVARAWGHWDKGQLWQRYHDPPQMLVELVELFNQERASSESYYMEEHMRQAKQKNG